MSDLNGNLEVIRVALQREFLERCQRNPSYSSRAFAKYLEVDQSFLSKLLRGQRAVTQKLANHLAPKLGLKPAQIENLFKQGSKPRPGFLPLSDDEFEILAHWHHFALLELAKTKSFKLDIRWISQRLGLHNEQVRDSVERLKRLGLIRVNDGQLKLLSPNNSWTSSTITSAARKKYQAALLEKSIEALEHVEFDYREHSSTTVAVNKSRLPEFKEKIKEFRLRLANEFQSKDEKNLDEVYQLTVSFFPATKIKTKTKV